MQITSAKYQPEYYEPESNQLCLCGSGIKFKKCCSRYYSSDAAKKFISAYKQGFYEDALLHARRHFTWYILCHKAHTVNLIKEDAKAGEELLQIDIEALEGILVNLHRCYSILGRSEEFPRVIDTVSDLIKDSRWKHKIAHAYSFWHLTERGDEASAFKFLENIDINTCLDVNVLSLYLQICPNDLSLPTVVSIIDRIIGNSKSHSVKLQYRVLKAFKYYLVCQQNEANRIIEDAILQYDQIPIEKRSTYGRMQFAYALEIYGKVGHRMDIIEQAKAETISLISEGKESGCDKQHIADMQRLQGDCEETLRNHKAAFEAYSQSLVTLSNSLTKVFMARSACNDGEIEKSRSILLEINEVDLDNPGRYDLVISWALLAATSLLAEDINKAKDKLKGIQTTDPAFIHLRDQWMIDLLEIKTASKQSNIWRLIKNLNGWITLNPNAFGIGININKIIDDIDSSRT